MASPYRYDHKGRQQKHLGWGLLSTQQLIWILWPCSIFNLSLSLSKIMKYYPSHEDLMRPLRIVMVKWKNAKFLTCCWTISCTLQRNRNLSLIFILKEVKIHFDSSLIVTTQDVRCSLCQARKILVLPSFLSIQNQYCPWRHVYAWVLIHTWTCARTTSYYTQNIFEWTSNQQ